MHDEARYQRGKALARLKLGHSALAAFDEILDRVWASRFVSESALTRSIAELRQCLRDSAGQPTIIETIPKRGYRLIADVEAGPGTPESESDQARLMIAVLPFDNLTGDPRQEYFSDGMTEELLAARLARRMLTSEFDYGSRSEHLGRLAAMVLPALSKIPDGTGLPRLSTTTEERMGNGSSAFPAARYRSTAAAEIVSCSFASIWLAAFGTSSRR